MILEECLNGPDDLIAYFNPHPRRDSGIAQFIVLKVQAKRIVETLTMNDSMDKLDES